MEENVLDSIMRENDDTIEDQELEQETTESQQKNKSISLKTHKENTHLTKKEIPPREKEKEKENSIPIVSSPPNNNRDASVVVNIGKIETEKAQQPNLSSTKPEERIHKTTTTRHNLPSSNSIKEEK